MAADTALHIDLCTVHGRAHRLAELAVLNDDLLVEVLSFLEPVSLQQTASACVALRSFACNDVFWSFYTLIQFGAPSRHLGVWRATYIQCRFVHSLLSKLRGGALVMAPRDSQLVPIGDQIKEAARQVTSCSQLPLHRSAQAILHPRLHVRNVTSQMLYDDCLVRNAVVEHFIPIFSCSVPSTLGTDGSSLTGLASSFDARWLATLSSYRPHEATISFPDMLPYVSAGELSQHIFHEHFEKQSMPFACSDAVSEWPAMSLWSPDGLAKLCGEAKFALSHRVGALYNQNPKGRLSMKHYVAYMRAQKDEMPLYVFDAKFAEKCPELLSHYDPRTLPCFKENFLAPMGKHMRPDFRWLVVGPARSGAPWHIDPYHTSAWNVCLFGRKRWMLYPPSQVPPGVEAKRDEGGHIIDFHTPLSPLRWMLQVFPTLPLDKKPLEIIQRPGDLIFIPAGWWHQVLNLDETVSVTENFMSSANLCDVIPDLVHEEAEGSQSANTVTEATTGEDIDSVWRLPNTKRDAHGVPDKPRLPCGGLSKYDAWKMLLLNEHPELKNLVQLSESYRYEMKKMLQLTARLASQWKQDRRAAEIMLEAEPEFSSRHHAAEMFDHVDVWYGPVLHAAGEHVRTFLPSTEQPSIQLETLAARANPVWMVKCDGIPACVVKYFSPYQYGASRQLSPEASWSSYRMEVAALRARAVAHDFESPVLLSDGLLWRSGAVSKFLSEDGLWVWPYVVMAPMASTSLKAWRAAQPGIQPCVLHARAHMDSFITLLNRCNGCPVLYDAASATYHLDDANRLIACSSIDVRLPSHVFTLASWQPYVRHLMSLRDSVVARRLHEGSLPAALMGSLTSWLPKPCLMYTLLPPDSYCVSPTGTPNRPKFVHADMTMGNVVGKEIAGVWTPTGLLDFADSMLGDPLYDVVPIFCSLFFNDSSMILRFLHSLLTGSTKEAVVSPGLLRFTLYRLTCLMILHPVDGFGPLAGHLPGLLEVSSSWGDFAIRMFGHAYTI